MATISALHSSLHTHNHYCDGDSTIDQVVEAAVACGLARLGISSHAPLPFGTEWTMDPRELESYRQGGGGGP
ncbi:MAG TPA: PHP domain-containing protein [Chloroflexota bacterium]|nr:PHP domain-containing protein [Chloroflexota bacterium]